MGRYLAKYNPNGKGGMNREMCQTIPTVWKDYRIYRISKDRLSDLLILFKSVFNQKVSLSYLEKKFDTKRFGASFIGYIAYTQAGDLAAYYGVFPIRFKLNNRVILAAQSGDTMTHKQHQRKGLFVKLANMTFDLARSEGIALIFGFPHENTLLGFIKKLNWTIDGVIPLYNLTVYTIPLAPIARALRLKRLYSSYFRFCARLLGLKISTDATLIDRNNSIHYDRDGIEYRNFSENYLFEHNKCFVWVKIVRTMQIGCIYRADDDHATRLLNRLKWLAAITGLVKMSFWCSDNHPNLRAIQSRFNEHPYCFYGHLSLKDSLTQFPSFFYEACDGDTY